MEETADGFTLSEKDLELRGYGEFFGNRQHGVPDSKISNLFTDVPILNESEKLWQKIFTGEFSLEKNEKLKEKIKEVETKVNTVYL